MVIAPHTYGDGMCGVSIFGFFIHFSLPRQVVAYNYHTRMCEPFWVLVSPSPGVLKLYIPGTMSDRDIYGVEIWYIGGKGHFLKWAITLKLTLNLKKFCFFKVVTTSQADVQKVISSCARKITGLNKTAGSRMAHHLADIPNIDEIYEIYGTLEYDRALRVENPSLRVLAESASANPGGVLNRLRLNLEQHFPEEESVRRFFPIKRGWRELFRNRSSVSFMAEAKDRVNTQEKAETVVAGADVVVYTDGSVTNPDRIAAPDNLAGVAWSIRDCENGTKTLSSKSVGRFQHSYGTERTAFTCALVDVRELLRSGLRDAVCPADRRGRIVILTDCLGLIMAMVGRKIAEAEDIDLHRELDALAGVADITVRHVSGHVGVEGSEGVDVAAKEAAKLTADDGAGSSLLHSAVKSELKLVARERRREDLRREADSLRLQAKRYAAAHALQNDFCWRGILEDDHDVQKGKLLCQIVAAHCPRAAEHPPRHDLDQHAGCETCGAGRATAPDYNHCVHYLLSCSRYADERGK
jgi:hypothetical protein